MRKRCEHRNAYETNNTSDDEARPTHWYCPTCDSYFPLIGNSDHWIKYLPENDSQTVSNQT